MLRQELSTILGEALSSTLGQVRVTLSGLSMEEEHTETVSVATGCHTNASPEPEKCTPRTLALGLQPFVSSVDVPWFQTSEGSVLCHLLTPELRCSTC